MADDFGFFSSSESGAPEAAEEDPAAAFLAQQESEIAGIENDEGFGAPAGSQGGLAQPGPASGGESARWPGYWELEGGIWGSHPGSSASGPCGRAKKACFGQPALFFSPHGGSRQAGEYVSVFVPQGPFKCISKEPWFPAQLTYFCCLRSSSQGSSGRKGVVCLPAP